MAIALLEKFTVAPPRTIEGIELFPIVRRETTDADAVASTESTDVAPAITLADDTLIVEELPHATVPQLQVRNPLQTPVLIPAGKILEGGRQTRTVNVSILVPAGATVEIPVSCVEAGRWGGGRHFGDSRRFASRRVRREKQRSVVRNLALTGEKRSDQGEVWRNIDAEFSLRSLSSDTGLFLAAEASIDDDDKLSNVVSTLVTEGPAENQVGVGIAYYGKVAGLELFSDPAHLQAAWEALVRNIVFDLPYVDAPSNPIEVTAPHFEWFLSQIESAETLESSGVGLGTEYHVNTEELVAQALVYEGELVYANAFVGS